MRNLRFLGLFLLLSSAACAAPTSADDGADPSAETDDLTAASDPTYVANAKAFFEALVNDNTHRDDARIPYAQLPSRLAKQVEKNNPNPKQEWAAEAYRWHVKNGKGHSVVVYGVMDGIDDEGESITVYTSTGKQIATGDDYRGFEWN